MALCAIGFPAAPATAAETLNICHAGHPVTEASINVIEKWARKEGVAITTTPIAYALYLPEVTRLLTTGSRRCDIVWHNDDWGRLWAPYLVATDDVAGMNDVAWEPLDVFWNDERKPTVVPMAHTVAAFFYRKDLVPAAEVPRRLEDMASLGERLQQQGKVRWGYVGGMAVNDTWFSLWWSMWNNGCDLFSPIYSRDDRVLAAEGWTPLVAAPCHEEIVDFWWDALHARKIAPEAMAGYGRDEANAVFEAGEAAFTVADSTFWGEFNDARKSAVAGKVAMAPFPVGPRRTSPVSWIDIWGWAVPKAIAPGHQRLAKKILGEFLADIDGQIEIWNETGSPPPNRRAWQALAAKDRVFRELKAAVFDMDHVHSAYYFANWPRVQKAYSDAVLKAISGPREAVPEVLNAGLRPIHDAAVAP